MQMRPLSFAKAIALGSTGLLLALASGCGSPPPAAPPPDWPSPEAEEDRSEATAGSEDTSAGEPETNAPEAVENPCEGLGLEPCYQKGASLYDASPPNPAAARAAFTHACTGGITYNDACARLAAMAFAGEGGPKDEVDGARAAKRGCSVLGTDDDNRRYRAEACYLYGIAATEGIGEVEANAGTAERAMKDACELGYAKACDAMAKAEPERLPGANIKMSSMTVDGLEVQDIACKTSGGGLGLLGAVTILAGFSERKGPLSACMANAKNDVTVEWKQAGTISAVKASGDTPAIHQCVENALRGAPATTEAGCIATLPK